MNIQDARIIAFTGKKGSGKSTAVEYMMSKLPGIRVNFKDALITELRERFQKTLELHSTIYGMTIDELFSIKPPLTRALMQEYGTNVRREDDPDYWVKQWYYEAFADPQVIYTDDVRFLNEATEVRKRGGIIIRIERKGHETGDTHVSEMEMDKIIADKHIIATTREDLYHQLNDLLTPKTIEAVALRTSQYQQIAAESEAKIKQYIDSLPKWPAPTIEKPTDEDYGYIHIGAAPSPREKPEPVPEDVV